MPLKTRGHRDGVKVGDLEAGEIMVAIDHTTATPTWIGSNRTSIIRCTPTVPPENRASCGRPNANRARSIPREGHDGQRHLG